MFIDGIALAGYRSFGPELQKIGPFKKINLIIGQNNSGKSNILLFLEKHYGQFLAGIRLQESPTFDDNLDLHKPAIKEGLTFGIPISTESSSYSKALKAFPAPKVRNLADKLIKNAFPSSSTKTQWLLYGKNSSISVLELRVKFNYAALLEEPEWQDIGRLFARPQNKPLEKQPTLIKILGCLAPAFPDISSIPAFRKIGNPEALDHDAVVETVEGNFGKDLSGNRLIEKLAYLQNPSHTKQDYKQKFKQINLLLQEVTGNNTANLEIPYERDMINVHMDDKVLPLSSCGTGIHEIIILAAAATVIENQVICIEEPEIHMHPILQRKLMRYLDQKTTNQYFIATHSAHLLDTPGAAIFHVRLENGCSIVDRVETAPEKACICFDLGYRASDLMQSNCIFWVEGPSDRIYVNHWLNALDENLIEGIHYSIMFYGGRLLNHLTADDPEIEAFISLRRMNRNLCIIMDSDMKSAEKEINDTKKRIVESFGEDQPGFAWVTQGREMENYIDDPSMKAAIAGCHPKAVFAERKGNSPYTDWFDLLNTEGNEIKADKIKVAYKVCEQTPKFDVLDLKERMDQLIKFIYKANGMEVQPVRGQGSELNNQP